MSRRRIIPAPGTQGDKHAQQYTAEEAKRTKAALKVVAKRSAAVLCKGDIIVLKVSRERLAVHSVMLSMVYATRGDGQHSWIDPVDIDFTATEPYSSNTSKGTK